MSVHIGMHDAKTAKHRRMDGRDLDTLTFDCGDSSVTLFLPPAVCIAVAVAFTASMARHVPDAKWEDAE